ncbi:MAG: homoserine dehydrogenase [Firmicutes bacterium]|nr:homoserine dehydrogenase [Bacillota bacterium]
MKTFNVALLGLGTVGTGVYRIIAEHEADLENKIGSRIAIRKILVRDIAKHRTRVPESLLTTDFAEIVSDPSIDVIVEVMGGTHPAYDYIRQALQANKHVVTANKELLAKHGKELLTLADEQGLQFRFEASVAGGVPIVKALKESLGANRISQVMGIINGTTNYILTRMSNEGVDIETALREAQAQGYAEADPTNDIDGFDAAYKLLILGSIAFGSRLDIEKIYTEGIRKITPIDLEYGRQLGYTLKLLAIAKETPEGIEARVHPTFIPSKHPLAAVSDVFNAIYVEGDAVGELMFYGRGAGQMPTASAVCSDIIDVALNCGTRKVCSCIYEKKQLPMEQTVSRYYVRISVKDNPGVLAKISHEFGENKVSLHSVIQLGRGEPVPLVFVTHEVTEANLNQAINGIKSLDCVYSVDNIIRVEGEA